MRYVNARYNLYQREIAYRIYVSECLRIVTENTAKYAGGNYIDRKFADLFRKKDKRSGEEVAADIISRAGLEVVG